MAQITYTDKAAGNTFTPADANEIKSVVNGNSAAIATETSRATGAEATALSAANAAQVTANNAATATALSNEVNRATNAEGVNATAIAAETLRATTADAGKVVYSAELSDFIYRAVTVGGGKISTEILNRLDTFVTRGKANGWWGAIKQLWIPVGDFSASKVFLVTPTGIIPTFNNFISSDYNQNNGYYITANINKYIDTGFIPNSNGVTSTNLSMGLCTLNEAIVNNNSRIVGCTPATSSIEEAPMISAIEGIAGFTNNGSAIVNCNFMGEGHIFTCHYGATTYDSVQNGVICMSGTQSITTAFDSAMTIYRTKRFNNLTYFANGSIGLYFMGTDLTSTLLIDMNYAIDDLMKSLRYTYQKPVVVTFGDSITAGQGTSLNFPERRWGKRFAKLVNCRERNIAQAASAISTTSAPYPSAISRYSTMLNTYPYFVAMMYGTNDIPGDANISGTQSLANTLALSLNTIISNIISSANGNHRIIVGGIPWRNASANAAKLLMYTQAAAYAAKNNGVPFVDVYNLCVDNGIANLTYFPDGLHPNDFVHNAIALGFMDAYLGRITRKPTLAFPSIAAGASADLTVITFNSDPSMTVNVTPPATLETGLLLTPINGLIGSIGTLGSIIAGTGYTNGTFTSVPLVSAITGTNATATVVVAGGIITSVIITLGSNVTTRGYDYTLGERLTAPSLVGGSGFSIPVVSVQDAIQVRLTNITGSAITPAPGQYKITVFTNV